MKFAENPPSHVSAASNRGTESRESRGLTERRFCQKQNKTACLPSCKERSDGVRMGQLYFFCVKDVTRISPGEFQFNRSLFVDFDL